MEAVAPLLLAHQSDWVSTSMVCIPLAFFAWVLHVAKRRAELRRKGESTP